MPTERLWPCVTASRRLTLSPLAYQDPSIAPSWRRDWQEVIPFFAFPLAVRKIIYTTNAIESLNRVIRKTTKTRGSFPTDDAATKLIYLAIRNFESKDRSVRSTNDTFQPHGPNPIHRVSNTPRNSGRIVSGFLQNCDQTLSRRCHAPKKILLQKPYALRGAIQLGYLGRRDVSSPALIESMMRLFAMLTHSG